MPAAWVSAGAALLGAYSSSKSPKEQTTTQQNQVDPRIGNMLFGGSDGNGPQTGLLNRFQSLLDTPQSEPSSYYSGLNKDYLRSYGSDDMYATHANALKLTQGNDAALATLPAYAQGSMVNAPSQNNINLAPTFQSLLNGGDNTALRQSLKYGTDLTNQQFAKNQTDMTNNLMRNVMPSIRSNSVLAGQYGGSRQGIAEGNAISDFTNQLNNSNTQIGLANSANTTGQLASDYQQGQARALAAAQGLSGQQYTTSLQDNNTKNAAEFMNVGNTYDLSKFNAGTTNQVNSANTASRISGIGLLNGMTTQAGNTVNAQNNYDLTRAQGVTSLLAPFIGVNGSSTTTQPVYQNTAGNIIGGATAGLGLYNQYKQATAGGNGTGSSGSYSANDWLSS
jgi:hypothetical protein